MDMINNLLSFIQNPDNGRILYAIALFLIVDAFILRFVNKRILTIKGNNSGIAVNGDVKGNITQHQIPTQTPAASNTTSSLLSLLANLSGIAGLILAATTFYLKYMK